MKHRIIHLAEKYRTALTRIIAVLLIAILLVSSHSFSQSSAADLLFEVSGIFLIGVCVLGRLWASLYVSGNKTHTLVTQGPYSIVRNPLYCFSFIGSVGIGLLSENVVILGLLALLFLLYYPLVVRSEEKELIAEHGERYIVYMNRVPRFIPKFSLLEEPGFFNVHTVNYRKTFLEVIWFVWFFIPLEIIERLHEANILPVLFRVP